MPNQSPLRLIKRAIEYLPKGEVERIPRGLRGIYVLYKFRRRRYRYEVVYVGMTNAGSAGGIRGRVKRHRERKGDLFTHFSAFEVWDNISDDEVAELEGLFRHIYRSDSRANRLNVQFEMESEPVRRHTLVNGLSGAGTLDQSGWRTDNLVHQVVGPPYPFVWAGATIQWINLTRDSTFFSGGFAISLPRSAL